MPGSVHRAFVTVAIVIAPTFGACSGGDTSDADAAADDATDIGDSFELFDAGFDSADVDSGIDVNFDVQPASLPGRWRLTGFSSTSAGGASFAATDQSTNVTYAGRRTYARVNGTMTLAADRMASSVSVLVAGHVLTFPGAGSAGDGMAVFASARAGTLAGQAFMPSGASAIAFVTNPDETISDTLALGSFGAVQLTWTRADTLAALAGLSSQGAIVPLQPDTAAPLAHPRAAIAWDRPGAGAGYTFSNDTALMLIGGVASFPVLVTYVLPEYTATISGTTISLGYVVVYDDVNGNGMFDPGTGVSDGGVDASSISDGGSSGDGGDPLRGVSRIVLTVRSQPMPSSGFLISPFRDVLPGVQLGTLRDDATVSAGTSVAPFDPTVPITPDGVIEAGGTMLPDLL